MRLIANSFNVKLFIIFGLFLVTLMLGNVRGEYADEDEDEDYSLDNNYYDQSYTFRTYDPYEKFNYILSCDKRPAHQT